MKKLAEKFVKKEFRHTLLKREGDLAIYRRKQVGTNATAHFEVVIITRHDGITINGNLIEAGELYPSSSQWGDRGWTCNTLELAEKRFLIVQDKLKELAKVASDKKQKSK
jgi:hypothetical protein